MLVGCPAVKFRILLLAAFARQKSVLTQGRLEPSALFEYFRRQFSCQHHNLLLKSLCWDEISQVGSITNIGRQSKASCGGEQLCVQG